MGVLAELGRLAVATWSPGGSGGGYIATGTYAGPIDNAFASTATLELFSVDIQRSKLLPAAQLQAPEKFCSLHWGNPSRSHQAGLIAAGLADGTVCIWDAAAVLRAPKSPDEKYALVFASANDSKKHSAAVRGIAFNPLIHTMMASGGADGQVLVWDISNLSSGVSARHPAAKSGPAPNAPTEDVTTLAWNRKVHNILSSATSTGAVNVWDLRQSRQVISIRNPRGRLRCSSLAWHPDIATQIVISCDEDDSTGALLWDLRNATAPVMTYAHHSPKGVSSTSWNHHDTDLLLTSSKDSRTVVVSVSTGEIVVDSPLTADWNFDVKWSPRVPGLYLASSYDGRLSVNSILAAASAPSVSSETANALAESFGAMAGDFHSGMADQSPRTTDTQRVIYSATRPPKWMKTPSSISFAFGGWRASSVAKDPGNVTVDSVDSNIPPVSDSFTKLDGVLLDVTSDDPSPALNWCKEQSASAETVKNKMAWEVLSVLFQTDSRRKLVEYLGFMAPPKDAGDETDMPVYGLFQSRPIVVPVRHEPSLAENIAGNETKALQGTDTATNGAPPVNLDGPAPWDLSDSPTNDSNTIENVLDGDDAANGTDDHVKSNPGTVKSDVKKQNGVDLSGKSKADIDEVIKRSVIVGNFQAAVDACLHSGRTADALIIAHAGGPDLWFQTQSEYLAKESSSSASKIIGAFAGSKNKMDEYIREAAESSEDSWKEAVAAILTYCSAEELSESCSALGNRLLHTGNDEGALVCFLCASNTRMVASTWMNQSSVKGKSTTAMMVDRIERLSGLVLRVRLLTAAILLSQGEREIGAVRALDDVTGSVLCEFGALLAAQGDHSLAITYLSNLDPSFSCVYGSAEDLNSRAAECLALTESAQDMASQGYNNPIGGGYNYPGAPPTGGTSSLYSRAPEESYGVPSYETPNPPTGGYTPALPPPMGAVPPPPSVPSMAPRPGMLAAGGGAVRPTRDPSDVYGEAPSANVSPQMPAAQVPAQLPPPPVGLSAPMVPTPGASIPSAVPPMGQPYMPPQPVAMGAAPPSSGGLNGMYGAPGVVEMTSGSGGLHGMPPPPMPPPPTDGEAPLPSSYHSKARHGSGASLPPSAEVAVAETRRAKAPSSSGMPGGPPKRSTSTSSSLSALATETVYLDKTDVSKIGAKYMIIVKALRGAFAHAQSLNQSPMYRKKMDDVNKRLGRLVAGLSAELLDIEIVNLLTSMAGAMEKGNFEEANSTAAVLSKKYWESNRVWILGLKWLLDCLKTGR